MVSVAKCGPSMVFPLVLEVDRAIYPGRSPLGGRAKKTLPRRRSSYSLGRASSRSAPFDLTPTPPHRCDGVFCHTLSGVFQWTLCPFRRAPSQGNGSRPSLGKRPPRSGIYAQNGGQLTLLLPWRQSAGNLDIFTRNRLEDFRYKKQAFIA